MVDTSCTTIIVYYAAVGVNTGSEEVQLSS
jgi:hypothetical protein